MWMLVLAGTPMTNNINTSLLVFWTTLWMCAWERLRGHLCLCVRVCKEQIGLTCSSHKAVHGHCCSSLIHFSFTIMYTSQVNIITFKYGFPIELRCFQCCCMYIEYEQEVGPHELKCKIKERRKLIMSWLKAIAEAYHTLMKYRTSGLPSNLFVVVMGLILYWEDTYNYLPNYLMS